MTSGPGESLHSRSDITIPTTSPSMKIITSFIAPTSGDVIINGDKIGADTKKIKKTIGYLPENNTPQSGIGIKIANQNMLLKHALWISCWMYDLISVGIFFFRSRLF